jgi:hypothetical protein
LLLLLHLGLPAATDGLWLPRAPASGLPPELELGGSKEVDGAGTRKSKAGLQSNPGVSIVVGFRVEMWRWRLATKFPCPKLPLALKCYVWDLGGHFFCRWGLEGERERKGISLVPLLC